MGQPFTTRTLVALVSLHLVFQLADRIPVVCLEDTTIQQVDTSLRCSLLDISSGGNFGGVQLQLP
jgi:preprotein translocase subunit SecY